MPQHEQLDVFGELAAPAPDQQPQHSREGEIGEGKEHAPMLAWRQLAAAEQERRSRVQPNSVAKASAIWYSRARVNPKKHRRWEENSAGRQAAPAELAF
jgi:hypothetical protein